MNQALAIEKAILLLRQAPASMLGGLMIAVTILLVFWGVAPQVTLLGWFSAFLLVNGARLYIWLQHRALDNPQDALIFQAKLDVLLVISGVVWGAGIWLLYPKENPLMLGIMVAIYAGLIAGAIGALAPSSRSYLMYCIPIGGSLILMLLLDYPNMPLVMPLGLGIFCGVCYLYTRNMESTIDRSIELRFENQNLISELQDREVQLSHAAAAAQDASDEKSRFLAVASHDLLQLMHALELFMRALRVETDPDKIAGLVGKAGTSTTLLSEMLSSLMDLSKLDANKIQPNFETTRLASVLTPIVDEMQALAAEKQLSLEMSIDDADIYTDPRLLQRVVINLINNAIKYTPNGTIVVSSDISSGETNGVVVLIEDTGIGIPAKELGLITKEYYQVGGRGSSGLGLGLSIVRRLNQLLGNRMTITSQEGKGTTVTLTIPVSAASVIAPDAG